MSDQEIQSVPFSEPSSDDVSITISPDSSNSASEHTRLIIRQAFMAASRSEHVRVNSQQETPHQGTAIGRYFMSFTQGWRLSDRERWNALRQAVVTARDREELNLQELISEAAASSSPFPVSDTQGRTLSATGSELEGMYTSWILDQPLAAASGSEHEGMNPPWNLGQALAGGFVRSEHEGMNTRWILGQALAAASGRMTDDRLSLFCSRLSEFNNVLYNYVSEHVLMNSQEGTLRQAAASSRSLADNIAVIGLIGANSAWLYGILFQLADKMHGSFFSHHRGMAMISGASMVYAAFSAVFLCVIFFLATADPTKTYRKRMRFLWGTYFYAACCGPAVLLMAMIDPSFGYKVLAWAVLGALFTPVGLYIGGYY